MGLFGKPKDPKDMVREWQAALRKEARQLDRQVLGIQREQEKVKRTMKDAAKKGDKDTCRVLAKEIVRSNKAVSRIYCAKAQLKSVENQMHQQLANLRLSGAMQKSAEVMKNMQSLVKVSDVAASMREMSKEMMKAGIIEEMMDDTIESVMDDSEEMEEEAQREVEKILWEVTAGQLGKVPEMAKEPLSVPTKELEESDEEVDVTQMQARLEALRS